MYLVRNCDNTYFKSILFAFQWNILAKLQLNASHIFMLVYLTVSKDHLASLMLCSRRHRARVGFKVQTITDKVRIKPVCKSERARLDVVFDVYFCLCGKKSELVFWSGFRENVIDGVVWKLLVFYKFFKWFISLSLRLCKK